MNDTGIRSESVNTNTVLTDSYSIFWGALELIGTRQSLGTMWTLRSAARQKLDLLKEP